MTFPISKYYICKWEGICDTEDLWVYWLLDLLLLVIVILLLRAIYSAIDWFAGEYWEFEGEIVDKLYKPESSSTGVGVGMVGGHAATVVTSNHSSEEWFVMVRDTEDKAIEKVYCSADFFYNKKVGDKIRFYAKFSRLDNGLLSKYHADENLTYKL